MPWLIWGLPVGVLILALWYVRLLARFGNAWGQLVRDRAGLPARSPSAGPSFSVLIAARDEAANLPYLLADLAAQHFPVGAFEVIIADDHSSDGTAAAVEAFAVTAPMPVRVVRLADLPNAGQGKKAALTVAIGAARHPWLAFTDADCRVGPHWLTALADALARNPALDLLSGPVALRPNGSALARLQVIEFAGPVGVGAATLALGRPTMCNGANLAVRRAAWEAVGGYAAHRHVASGDDEFLLHALWARRRGSAAFVADARAVVRTAAAPTVGAFLRQRVRWASKWRHYQQPGAKGLAAGVFGLNLGLLLGAGWGLTWPATAPLLAGAWAVKLAVDAWFLRRVLRLLGETRHFFPAVLAWQLLYVPYVVFVGLRAQFGAYRWKGRLVALAPANPT